MQKLVLSLVVVVVAAACAHDRSAALEKAEAQRRAEILEAQEAEARLQAHHIEEQQKLLTKQSREAGGVADDDVESLASDQRVERLRLQAEQSKEQAALAGKSIGEVARAAEEVAVKDIALAKDAATFQARAHARLDGLVAKIVALKETAQASKKPRSMVESVVVDARALRDDVEALQEKLPVIVELTSTSTWTPTKERLDKEIATLEDRYQVLNDQI